MYLYSVSAILDDCRKTKDRLMDLAYRFDETVKDEEAERDDV